MQNLRKNILLEMYDLIVEFFSASYKAFGALFLKDETKETGVLMSLIHHIITLGPRNFREFPTASTIGKAFFSPLVFLFSLKKTHETHTKN